MGRCLDRRRIAAAGRRGPKLQDRLSQIAASLDQVAARAGSLPGGLSRLQQLLRRGLEQTAALFPPVREAFSARRVARILKNQEQLSAPKVRRRLVQLLVRMRQAAATTDEPSVRDGLKHFLKVTRSYWPGLFGCYQSSDLPRTNNGLEHAFGSHRYHERRASGRRRATPGLVVMGSCVIRAWRPGCARRKAWSCGQIMCRDGKSCEQNWSVRESRRSMPFPP